MEELLELQTKVIIRTMGVDGVVIGIYQEDNQSEISYSVRWDTTEGEKKENWFKLRELIV